MFLKKQEEKLTNDYFDLLKTIGSLSNLFSEGSVPYLYYRAHENAFCRAFKAENLSRSDVSADAEKDGFGIGLKTFLNQNGNTFQKVAEFNRSRDLYASLEDRPVELTKAIAKLRNKRIEATKSLFNINKMIYHCVARSEKKMIIFEEDMDVINIEGISGIKKSKAGVLFFDGSNEYNFNFSKSTLFKRFSTNETIELDIEILEDPFEAILKLAGDFSSKTERAYDYVILPLYSTKGKKHVPEKSQLNQWNAGGRPRDKKEVYIPIPAWIHKKFENFFPGRKKHFNLHFPNKKAYQASICQDGGKALMTKKNSDLGNWLINEVLKVEEGKLVTYNMLEEIGIDSVMIRKIDEDNFAIDFKGLGTFDEFELNCNQ